MSHQTQDNMYITEIAEKCVSEWVVTVVVNVI